MATLADSIFSKQVVRGDSNPIMPKGVATKDNMAIVVKN